MESVARGGVQRDLVLHPVSFPLVSLPVPSIVRFSTETYVDSGIGLQRGI